MKFSSGFHLWLLGLHSTSVYFIFAFVVVADPYPGLGDCSDPESDGFAVEAAVGTPAPESDAMSVLPEGLSRQTRTQHNRPAVGLELSVVHNEWEKGTILSFCCTVLLIVVMS